MSFFASPIMSPKLMKRTQTECWDRSDFPTVMFGPQQGKKVFTLQTVPATESDGNSQVAQKSGLSLHAGVAAQH